MGPKVVDVEGEGHKEERQNLDILMQSAIISTRGYKRTRIRQVK